MNRKEGLKRFFAANVTTSDKAIAIDGEEFHYFLNVLRLRINDMITVLDGKGLELSGRVRKIKKSEVIVDIEGVIEKSVESSIDLFLLQGLLKGEKMDIVVQKATELGVSAILPFYTERTIPRLDGTIMTKRLLRWRKIAREATRQCGRRVMPSIDEALPFSDMIQRNDTTLKIALWEKEKSTGIKCFLRNAKLDKGRSVTILIGSEGGLSQKNINEARKNGFVTVGMGDSILRAETATIAAVTLLQYELGYIK